MTPEEELSTVNRFFIEVGIINQLVTTKLEAILPGRMSATQFGVLGHLARRPDGQTPLQLAQAFQTPKTTMTHMLAGLENAGFISLKTNPQDRRSKIACVTEAGGVFLTEKTKTLAAQLQPIMAELSIGPFSATLPDLERIRIALDKDRDQLDQPRPLP